MPRPSDWLLFAKNDLKTAVIVMEADEGLLSTVLYHVQQCAEKSLKAYLVNNGMMPPRTHDIIKLVECCTQLNQEFAFLLQDASDINPFSTATRYPDDYCVFPSLDTARVLIKKSEAIYEFVVLQIYLDKR